MEIAIDAFELFAMTLPFAVVAMMFRDLCRTQKPLDDFLASVRRTGAQEPS